MLAVRDRLQLHPPRVERGRDALQLNRPRFFVERFMRCGRCQAGKRKSPRTLRLAGFPVTETLN